MYLPRNVFKTSLDSPKDSMAQISQNPFQKSPSKTKNMRTRDGSNENERRKQRNGGRRRRLFTTVRLELS